MARAKKNDYFDMMVAQAELSVRAAELLERMLCGFHSEEIMQKYAEMHQIEHEGDILHHDILGKLSAEFITPIDQEDILRLVQIIDDVTDALDEVTLDFYMYNLQGIPAGADAFSSLVTRCVKALLAAVRELKNFKKPEKLRECIVEVNHVEAEADGRYTELVHGLFVGEIEPKTLIGSKAIFDSLESCCDLCEDAADVIEQIIIKNT